MTEQQGGPAGPAAEEGLHWDEGSAQLLDAYCDAVEGREPGDDGPGS
jgi:hypothetical protein